MSATIKDVAKSSGVSVSTISKYLCGGKVRRTTSEKIDAAVSALNYRVNQSARALKTNRSMLVGILVDSILNSFYDEIISYASSRLQARNYSCIVCETKESAETMRKQMDFLLQKNVDGILILSTNIPAVLLETVYPQFKNIVIIDSAPSSVGYDYVTVDNIPSTYQAIEQFIVNGHRQIAIVVGDDRHFSARERLSGYRRALEDYGIPINENFIFRDEYDIPGGYRAFKKVIAALSAPNHPTAVMISSYFMTVGSIIAINETSLRIPADLSVICFDNLNELNKIFRPQLTCIIQPTEEISRSAVELLLNRIAGLSSEPRVVRLPTSLVSGASVRGVNG